MIKNQIKGREIPAFILLFFFTFLFYGCKKEKVPEVYKPSNAHKAYIYSLQELNLAETALGKDWIDASIKALNDPVEISPPFEEVFYIDPNDPDAYAYLFSVKRGQRIEVDISFYSKDSLNLFIDLFREYGTSVEEWILVASADKKNHRLEFEPRRDARYMVRLQPELLRGGQFSVIIRIVPSLDFPVEGRNNQSIQSFFDSPRYQDGQRVRHNGVDIFARRHTPVLAPCDAYVQRVDTGEIAGNYIYLYDSKRYLYIYFAHLQTQDVKPNTRVNCGQVIGTIGNTGNAITTPPHLHFGVYASGTGAVDPYPFIAKTNTQPVNIFSSLDVMGQWVRLKQTANLKSLSSNNPAEPVSLNKHSIMKVIGASASVYRVVLPDGISGYITANAIESATEILEQQPVINTVALLENPEENAVTRENIHPGKEYYILGKYNGYWMVKTQEGNTGWMQILETNPTAI